LLGATPLARDTMITFYPTNGADTEQQALALQPARDEHLDVSSLETWLWDATCVIRGATDAPKFKDFILPLVFYKQLSDVFDDEFAEHVAEFGDEERAQHDGERGIHLKRDTAMTSMT
jgi:type I restriction-modification system DNA methylase subunit